MPHVYASRSDRRRPLGRLLWEEHAGKPAADQQTALSIIGWERWPECSGGGAAPLSEHNSSAGEIAVETLDR